MRREAYCTRGRVGEHGRKWNSWALLRWRAAVSAASLPSWKETSGALGLQTGHSGVTAALLRTCCVARPNDLTLGCAAKVSQKIRGQREDNGRRALTGNIVQCR